MKYTLVVVALSSLAAPAALACLFRIPDPTNTAWSVEDREVPRNAQVRAQLAARIGPEQFSAELFRPDSDEPELLVADENDLTLLVLQRPLEPGPHSISATGFGESRTNINFTVVDDVDSEPPEAPLVTVTSETIFPSGTSCDQPPRQVTTVEVNGTTGLALARITSDGVTRDVVSDGTSEFVLRIDPDDAGGSGDYEVVVVDHAGNVSAPTTVSAWRGCPGACSSSPVGDVALTSLALGLMLWRRERRHT